MQPACIRHARKAAEFKMIASLSSVSPDTKRHITQHCTHVSEPCSLFCRLRAKARRDRRRGCLGRLV